MCVCVCVYHMCVSDDVYHGTMTTCPPLTTAGQAAQAKQHYELYYKDGRAALEAAKAAATQDFCAGYTSTEGVDNWDATQCNQKLDGEWVAHNGLGATRDETPRVSSCFIRYSTYDEDGDEERESKHEDGEDKTLLYSTPDVRVALRQRATHERSRQHPGP